MRRTLILLATAASLLLAVPALTDDLTAAQIIEKSAENRNVRNSVQTMILRIYGKSGSFRERKIESKIKEGEDGRARSYVRFLEPEDVEGVQFLTIQNPAGEDDQWLFMPAGGGMLTRISGSSKKGSFMGTDFRFEDLEVGSAEDGTHELLGEETIEVAGESFVCFKISTVPNESRGSSYTKIVTWVSKDDFVPRKVEFYDKKGELEKRMTLQGVKKDGDNVIPTLTVMENLKRGTKTEVIVEDYRTNVDPSELPDEIFTPDYLQSEG